MLGRLRSKLTYLLQVDESNGALDQNHEIDWREGYRLTTIWGTRPPTCSYHRLANMHDHWPTMPRPTGSNIMPIQSDRQHTNFRDFIFRVTSRGSHTSDCCELNWQWCSAGSVGIKNDSQLPAAAFYDSLKVR